MKKTRRETVIVDHNGKKYTGSRVIEGTNKLFQTIYYGGRSRADGVSYTTKEETHMSNIARIIMLELIGEIEREKK